jgi:Archaeal ATPase.
VLVGLRVIKVDRRRGVRRVELELVPGLRVEFTDRERALGQVEEWAERGTRFPVVIFGPEGCGKSAFLRQASAMLKELGFDVFYLHPLEREFRAEVAVPDIRREFVQFVERALGENALGRVAWAALDFVRKLQKARRGRIAVVADDVFQAIGLDAVAAYVKALLNLSNTQRRGTRGWSSSPPPARGFRGGRLGVTSGLRLPPCGTCPRRVFYSSTTRSQARSRRLTRLGD